MQKPAGGPRKPTGSQNTPNGPAKAKGKIEDGDDEDPLAEIKSLQKEEISTEAIPASELKKAKYEKQIPGQFDFEAFDTKGFGEGYSKEKKAGDGANVLWYRYYCRHRRSCTR